MSRPGGVRSAPDDGFTIVEMVVAITLLAISLLALAQLMYGSMSALGAVQQRSQFTEVATAEMEGLRATSYDEVCVVAADLAEYDAGSTFEGLDAVVGTSCPAAVTALPGSDDHVAHTVRRWVTWTDTAGGTGHQFKRLTVVLEWLENNRSARSVRLTSILYPGGLGVDTDGNHPPVAVLEPPTGAVAGTPISFDATASTDPDVGDVLGYAWDFGDGGPVVAGTATAVHTYAASGTYTAQVTVSDQDGASSVASQAVTVAPPASSNTAPTAVATNIGTTYGTAPYPVTVDGYLSTDPEGDTLTYSWDWGDGSADTSGVQGAHVYAAAGVYTIALTVTDTGGLASTATISAAFLPLNCDVVSGSFRNPGANPTADDLLVNASNRPADSNFAFAAQTNEACSTLSAHVPTAGTDLVVVLAKTGTVSGVVTWAGSATSSAKFNLGSQTYDFRTPANTGTEEIYSVGFVVHK